MILAKDDPLLPAMTPLGQHSLFDLHDCDAAKLSDRDVVREAMLEAVRQSGGTIVADIFHQFSPHGVSGVVVIAESHLTIHTWPERSFAAVDLFTCGTTLDHSKVESLVAAALGATRVDAKTVPRG
jgi:S-adenosylmethionine decarboxylase